MKRPKPPPGLGATGQFPAGKITPTDEGEIRFAIAFDPVSNCVILDFGKPVVWLGLPKEKARALANMLLDKAR